MKLVELGDGTAGRCTAELVVSEPAVGPRGAWCWSW